MAQSLPSNTTTEAYNSEADRLGTQLGAAEAEKGEGTENLFLQPHPA